jgi:hypothetical protein
MDAKRAGTTGFEKWTGFTPMPQQRDKEIVESDLRDLNFALQQLDTITPPDLPRPAVPYQAPPTQELLAWAIRVYFYSTFCQFRELLRATLTLVNADLVPGVFLCSRGLFELAAHAYYVKKHVLQHLENNDFKAVWQFLYEVNLGSREMRDVQKDQSGESDYPEGPHIAKVMACFNEYFKNGHKEKVATKTYSGLSEFSHPNCYAFINHFEWESDLQNMAKVTFGKPSRNQLIMCLPAASMAVV